MNLLQCLCLFKHVKVQGILSVESLFTKVSAASWMLETFEMHRKRSTNNGGVKSFRENIVLKTLLMAYLKPPFHQGLFFFPIGPIWTRLYPINQSFYLLDGRPQSPPIAPLFLTRSSPDFINELPARESPWRGLFLLLNSFHQSTVKLYYIRRSKLASLMCFVSVPFLEKCPFLSLYWFIIL